MNKYSAYPHRLPGGRYWAMIRVCRDSQPSPVMDVGDKPKVFDTKGDAALECLKHVVAFMNGREIRGETFEMPRSATAARAKAEMLFLGGGKVVQVERLEATR